MNALGEGDATVTLRRAVERHRVRRPEPDAWLTFYPPTRVDPLADSFGSRLGLKEIWLPPGAAASRELHQNGELLTYVREGNFTHEDSSGDAGLIQAGEFHLLTVSESESRSERNASATDSAHVYQLCLRYPMARRPVHPAQQQRFSAAQRRGQLCLVVSPDAHKGSLRSDHDARVYSALLEPGQHVVHEMAVGHCAWLHLIDGAVSVGELMLYTGDGVGVRKQRGLAITTREASEILLVDMLEG